MEPNYDLFIEDVLELCDKHRVCIGHEDFCGSLLLFEPDSLEERECYYQWLKDAIRVPPYGT